MGEELLLERYRVADRTAARFGGEAVVAEDTQRGALVEVHRLPATPEVERAYAQVHQAVEALQALPPGPVARALEASWGPDGELVLVLEYQEGRRLSDLLAEGPLEPRRVRELLRGVLHALSLARRCSLGHGALTPARVVVGPEDRVAVLDIGLAALPRPSSEDAALEAAYRAPGGAAGARADAYAVAVLALELASGTRPEPGKPLAPVPEPVQQALGAEFVKAVQALARADGSARAFDAGALLGLLPATQRRTRRGRYAVRETWDGDIGSGTARLLRLAQAPEYASRMPEEIRGQRAVVVEDRPEDGELRFHDTVVARQAPVEVPPTMITPRPAAPVPPVEAAPPVGPADPRPRPGTTRVEVQVPSDPFLQTAPRVAAPPPPPPPPAPAPAPPAPATPPGAEGQVKTVVLPRPAPEPTRKPDPVGEAVTMPVGVLAPQAPPAGPPGPVLLLGGKAAYFVVSPRDASLDVGRERGNEVILRAFKNGAVESVDSNRISRKHLAIARRGAEVFVSDKKSTYGTALGPNRLPPEGETPLPATFQLTLAQTSVKLDGRVLLGASAVRLVRLDGAGHQYVLLWAPGEVTAGSAEATDALLLPADQGVVPGHAKLVADAQRGQLLIGPRQGKVAVNGRDVAAGQLVPLGEGTVQLGSLLLRARGARDEDYLSVATSIV